MKESLEQTLVQCLKKNKLFLTTAESCTGGLVAAAVTSVPGASAVFREGYVTYCDDAKHRLLGVCTKTLQRYTAVSAQVAQEMAEGGAVRTGAQVCVSVTGVAGPDLENGRPVGLVYIGCYYKNTVSVQECHFDGSRQEIREQACTYALKLVLSEIKKKNI